MSSLPLALKREGTLRGGRFDNVTQGMDSILDRVVRRKMYRKCITEFKSAKEIQCSAYLSLGEGDSFGAMGVTNVQLHRLVRGLDNDTAFTFSLYYLQDTLALFLQKEYTLRAVFLVCY